MHEECRRSPQGLRQERDTNYIVKWNDMWCSQEMAFHEQVAEAQVKRYEAKIQGVEAFREGKPLFVTNYQIIYK